MATGDIVASRLSPSGPSALQAQPAHFGILTSSSTTVPDVLWDTAKTGTLTAGAQADLNLDVIEDALPATLTTFTGKTVLRISPSGTPSAVDPAAGTSREFVGTVVAIYKRTPFGDAPGTGADHLLVKSWDLYFEDVATQFAVLTDR